MDDLISRQAAIDAIQKYKIEHGFTYCDCACEIERDLMALPSAEPKSGKWVHLGNDEWSCSRCGNVISTEGSWEHPLSEQQEQRYCFFCGAKMEKPEDDRWQF